MAAYSFRKSRTTMDAVFGSDRGSIPDIFSLLDT
jgi:hypothetical protein